MVGKRKPREETSNSLIEAVQEIVRSAGIVAVTVRSVTKQAGIPTGAFYTYFDTMEELILKALSTSLDGLGKALEAAPRLRDPVARLHSYADIYLEYLRENDGGWRALLEYRKNSNKPPPDWYVGYIEKLAGLVGDCLMESAPNRAPQDAVTSARLMWAGIYGLGSLESEGRLRMIFGKEKELSGLVHDLINVHVRDFIGR